MPPVINKDKCNKCEDRNAQVCVDACTEDVFFGSKMGEFPVVTYPDECVHFNCCVLNCPIEGAISLRTPLTMMLLYK